MLAEDIFMAISFLVMMALPQHAMWFLKQPLIFTRSTVRGEWRPKRRLNWAQRLVIVPVVLRMEARRLFQLYGSVK
jgi:hypothetical protein